MSDLSKTLSVAVITLIAASVYAAAKEPDVPPLKCVYFIPSDEQAIPGTPERLGRVMKSVQDFYRREMKRNGFGAKTFALEWETPENLKLYVVNGKQRDETYGYGGSGNVGNEIRPVLKQQYGIDMGKNVIVCFRLSHSKQSQKDPETGGGGHLSGVAWLKDNEQLDTSYNAYKIGVIAHELGHALGMGHCGETKSEKDANLGTSVMGGIGDFGKAMRGEANGTFLTKASALRLSTVRAVSGEMPGSREQAKMFFERLSASLKTNADTGLREVVVTGKVRAVPPLLGIAVFNDSEESSNYHCQTWAAPVNKDGTFSIVMDDVSRDRYDCTIQGIHISGHTNSISLSYYLKDGKENLLEFNLYVPMMLLREAFKAKNIAALKKIGANYKTIDGYDFQKVADFACELLMPEQLYDAASLPDKIKTFDLSYAVFTSATAGWGKVLRRQVPDKIFIKIGGKLFQSGLFAHAESYISINLGGLWREFDFGYGIQDGESSEALIFTVLGDGRELFRSGGITDHTEHRQSVSVNGVKTLELCVEKRDKRRTTNSSWSVWTKPMLKR